MTKPTAPMIVAIMENFLALLECSWAIVALPVCHAGSTLVALMMAAIPDTRDPEQEDRDDRPGQVVVGLHAAGRGGVTHLGCAVGLLAVGLLRILAVWGGHTSSLDLLQMLGRP
jgi:hypothetical protein